MPSAAITDFRINLDFCLAGTNVRFSGPEAILSVLDTTLSFVPRLLPTSPIDFTIAISAKDDVWEIRGYDGSLKVLGANSALPQVLGAVVSQAVADVAIIRNCKSLRASVIELHGRALALIGDDWESALTVATHLHGRGWRYVGSDNVWFDGKTLEVLPLQKCLYINASALSQLPGEYRRAVEVSPWHVTSQGIAFYAVDPRCVGYEQTWAGVSRLCGAVVVDGTITERSALESLDMRSLESERFTRIGIDWTQVPIVDLRIGGFVECCDLIEHWFGVNQS